MVAALIVPELLAVGLLTCLACSDANCCKQPLRAAQVCYSVHGLHLKGVIGVCEQVRHHHVRVH